MMKAIAPYATAMLLLLFVSCSKTFEDRGDCPCVLTLDCSGLPASVRTLDVWILDGSSRSSYMKKVYITDFSSPVSIDIDRLQTLDICVWGNMKHLEFHGSGTDTYFLKRKSVDADSLYREIEHADSRCDELHHKLSLTKEFSRVTLLFSPSMSFEKEMELIYHQPVSGYYIQGGSVEGDASTSLLLRRLPDGQNAASFNMLRNDLKNTSELELILPFEKQGNARFSIPIWKYLQDAGFDMEKRNLDDITFSLDYSFNVTGITINDWTDCPPYRIEF